MRQAQHQQDVCQRIRKSAQFSQVFDHGRRIACPFFALHFVENSCGAPRLGLAVSKKVDARAVGRNRIKRQVRESFRAEKARLPTLDFVVMARPASAKAETQQLRTQLLGLWQKATLLQNTTVGTMLRPPSVETQAVKLNNNQSDQN